MKTSKHNILIRINLMAWIAVVISLCFSTPSQAQSGSKNTLLQMIDDNRTTIDAIAGYDETIQRHILQVVQTPELLNKIEELQKRSQNQFRAIIAQYDQETQGAFYDLARYPNLIAELVSNGRPSSSEINRIILNYPADIHETAKKYAGRYFDVLQNIDRLNSEIDRAFKYSLEPYSLQTRESVNVLIGYPEIVSALVDDKEFTVLLGEIYREDPNWVILRLNLISKQLAEQNREDLDAYKNQIQNDPEAYNELLEASEKYARETNQVRYLKGSSDPIVEVRVINSYPYWFGYPYWYSDPYWRPLPFYYHTGFYRNNFGAVVFVGLPSFNFIRWQTHYHPSLFPHLSYNYYSYYENHYINRYRNSHRPIPHHEFYRSIEANVINNPRVNNSMLERIDHQRGNNIVRQPNRAESTSTRRGESSVIRRGETSNSRPGSGISGNNTRRGTGTINRNGIYQRNSETNRGTINNRGTERNNSGTSGSRINRREYNTVNPGKSEGPVNRRGSGIGSESIRRDALPATQRQQRTSTDRARNRTVDQQQSVIPQQNRQSTTPAEQPGRAAAQPSQVERSSSPVSAAKVRSSARSAQREAREAATQSTSRRAAREKRSSAPAVSSENVKEEAGNGRRK